LSDETIWHDIKDWTETAFDDEDSKVDLLLLSFGSGEKQLIEAIAPNGALAAKSLDVVCYARSIDGARWMVKAEWSDSWLPTFVQFFADGDLEGKECWGSVDIEK
jgi:hypothetical protein